MEGQVSIPNGSPCNREFSSLIPEPGPEPGPGLHELWDMDPLLSLPVNPCKSITFANRAYFCNNVFPFYYSSSFDPAAGALLCGFL